MTSRDTQNDQRNPQKRTSAMLRWFVGVPIGSNPLFLVDFAFVVVLLWAFSSLFIIVGQRFIGGMLDGALIRASLWLGTYIAGTVAAAFAFVAFIILNNRYAALFQFEQRGAFCETMRGTVHPLKAQRLPWRPFGIEPKADARHSAEKHVPWGEVTTIQEMPGLYTFILKSGRKTLMKVYCPDAETYAEALAFASGCIQGR